MTTIASEVPAGAPLPELNQVLIQQRIDYLHQHTDFALTLFRELGAYAIVALDFDGNVIAFNEGARRAFGYTPQEVIGRVPIDAFFPPEFTEAGQLQQAVAAVLGEQQFTYDGDMLRNGGQRFPVHAILTLTKDLNGQIVGFILLAEDITERKQAQEKIEQLNAELEQRVLERTAQLEAANRALTASERRFRTVIETALDGILVVDVERHLALLWNRAICDMLGYSPEEMSTLGVEDIHPPEALPEVLRQFERQRKGEIKVALDLPVLRKDGSVFFADITASPMTLAGRNYQVGIFHDVTERRRAEEDIRRLNWALRALGQSNSALVHAGTERELFQACCDAIVGSVVYSLAWIGLVMDDSAHSIEVAAAAGEARKYMQDIKESSIDTPSGGRPIETAIRTGVTQVANNLAESAACLPWIEHARTHGLASSIALPIRANGSVIGVLAIYSREVDAFNRPEVELFEELAADIGYGIASRRILAERDRLQQSQLLGIKQLKNTLIGTIGAVALTLEKRDPYTAGHQQRVTALCVAIGQELNLSEDCLEGLRLGATIHDIGKIYVPAEILSRPGKLTALEFEIIKSHPQVGYDIIKDVKFPWPVADMILQHHERLDGSGYPQGLKGDEIILEARILAVADVLEAMSSHRPYRAAQGMEVAIKELQRVRGSELDPAVVDACVRLYQQNRLPPQ